MLHLNVIEDSRMQPCFKDENKEAPMERSPLHGFGCSYAKPLILVKAGLLLALPVRLMCPTHQKLLFTPNYPRLGALIGVSAALISIITEWLSDIKTGYCRDGWWLNHQFCCWEIETEENICEAWVSWSHYSVFQWLIYVVFAVSDGLRMSRMNTQYSCRRCSRLQLGTWCDHSRDMRQARVYLKLNAFSLGLS